MSVVFTLLAGALITPLREEAFFRGVITNVLLVRYGAWIGIVTSTFVEE